MTQEAPFLTVPEVAERLAKAGLNFSASTVQRWCRKELIERVKLPGGQYRVRASVVDAFIENPTAFPQKVDAA